MTWTRRQFLENAALASAAGLVASSRAAAWQQAEGPPTVTFTAVRGGVGVAVGRGGTIGWLVDKDALVVVDTQFPDTARQCLEGLKQKSSRKIDFLVNTHHHGDHTAGNVVFKPEARAVVAHRRVPELQKQAAAQRKTEAEQAYADTLYDTEWRQNVGSETLRLRHHGPAHTGGDSIVTLEKANVVHMGDLMFRELHPFIDRPGGASARNWIKVLEKAVADHDADTIFIFGHAREGLGVTGDRSALHGFRDYLTAVIEHVEAGVKAGNSRDEITAATAIPKFEQYQGNRLASVLGVVYDEVTSS